MTNFSRSSLHAAENAVGYHLRRVFPVAILVCPVVKVMGPGGLDPCSSLSPRAPADKEKVLFYA